MNSPDHRRRYRRVRSLGHGAMGEVWLADDTLLGRSVAIKQLRLEGASTATGEQVQRIEREARVAAKVHHPNVVGFYDLLLDDGVPQLVMEYVQGESLADRIARQGPLSPTDAAAIFSQVARGLGAAHELGVVHRDVKPANIIVTGDGRVKVADFGIARGHGDATLTDVGHVTGTIAYMAPEVARGAQAGPASDLWSLGASLYAAVEGHAPFGSTADQSLATLLLRLVSEPVPPPLRAAQLLPLLGALLDADPHQRPRADEVARMLSAPASDLQATMSRVVSGRPQTAQTVARAAIGSAFVPEMTAPRPHAAGAPLPPADGGHRFGNHAVAIWSAAAVAVVAVLAAAAVTVIAVSDGGSASTAQARPVASTSSPSVPSRQDVTPTRTAPVTPSATDTATGPIVTTGTDEAADSVPDGQTQTYSGPGGIVVSGPADWTEDTSENAPTVLDADEPGSPARLAGATFRIGVGNPTPSGSFESEARAAAGFLVKHYDASIVGDVQYSDFRGTTAADIEYEYFNTTYDVQRHAVERIWRENGVTYIVQSSGRDGQWAQTRQIFDSMIDSVEVS